MRVFNTVEEMKECVGQEIGVSDWFAIDQAVSYTHLTLPTKA